MGYCIATIIGFVLGAACVIGTILFEERKNETPLPSAALTPSPREEGVDEENLKKQWENFINYDGTPDGQTSIGDE